MRTPEKWAREFQTMNWTTFQDFIAAIQRDAQESMRERAAALADEYVDMEKHDAPTVEAVAQEIRALPIEEPPHA